jgi:hypothetical protein
VGLTVAFFGVLVYFSAKLLWVIAGLLLLSLAGRISGPGRKIWRLEKTMKLIRMMIILVGLLLLVGPAARAQSDLARLPMPAPVGTQNATAPARSTPAPAPKTQSAPALKAPSGPCWDAYQALSQAQEAAPSETIGSPVTSVTYSNLPQSDFTAAVACLNSVKATADDDEPYINLYWTAATEPTKPTLLKPADRKALENYIQALLDQNAALELMGHILTTRYNNVDATNKFMAENSKRYALNDISSTDAAAKAEGRYNSLVSRYNDLVEEYNSLLQTARQMGQIASELAARASTPTRSPLQDLANYFVRLANRPPTKHITCETNGYVDDSSSSRIELSGNTVDTTGGGTINTTTDCTEQ